MVTMTQDILRDELRRRAGPDGAVTAETVAEVKADGAWEGRLWEVLGIFSEDFERMAYLAGGVLPDEVATWVGFWSDAQLEIDEIRQVIAAGGYDPDPFVVLGQDGRLDEVLMDGSGGVRRIEGELAGAWISDRFADATDEEVRAWARSWTPPEEESGH